MEPIVPSQVQNRVLLNFQVTEDERIEIHRAAERQGISTANLIRKALSAEGVNIVQKKQGRRHAS